MPRRNPTATQMRHLDRRYTWNHFLGAGREGEMHYIEGEHVLFTAPHSVRQVRRHGRQLFYKPGDRWTGPLAELLAKQTGAGALTMVGAKGDAARDDPHPFRSELAKLIDSDEYRGLYNLVIDLHGMTNGHGVDVSIGLGSFPTPATVRLAADLAEACDAEGLFWAINPDRLAAAELTITSFAQRHDVQAMQIELAADIRNPASGAGDRLARALAMLGTVVSR